MDLFGFAVEVRFRVQGSRVLAYGWHRDATRAGRHLGKIVAFHRLPGESVADAELEAWLGDALKDVVERGRRFSLPDFPYRDRAVYEALLEVPRGGTLTYGELAKRAGLPYPRVLSDLLKNPFQVLVPRHRLVTKKGTLLGFYPLGLAVKRRLLELEGIRLGE